METGQSGPLGRPSVDGALLAAFGAPAGDPGPARSPSGLAWLRAVDLAGRGRFAAARVLTGSITSGPFASAARCLDASMLRQSGRHREASAPDGAALAIALAGEPGSALAVASRVDAAVGLAADALGTGRYALSARMLDRADGFLAEFDGGRPSDEGSGTVEPAWWTVPRARLRRDWVAAEYAVYSGDREGAERALPALIAADPGPTRPRHHAKTLLIIAAAAAATGDLDHARNAGMRAHRAASEDSLDPLQWAGAKMMTALSSPGAGEKFMCDAAAVEARWIRAGARLARL